jgi:hypothetical protein
LEETLSGTTPVAIDTYTRLASMRQIHCAIEHIYRGDYECAITLASAAENMLPEPSQEYLRHKIKALSVRADIKAAGGATEPNDFATWLKHGTYNGKKTGDEVFTIPNEESIAWACRAISKYNAVYNDLSPQMGSFQNWVEQWLKKELGR